MYLLPILSGLLIGTSYIPFPPWAIFFCYIPLWIFWTRQERLYPMLLGSWLTSFILTLIGFHWIAHTAHEFGQMPWAASLLVLAAFCCLGNLFPVVSCLMCWLTRRYLKPPEYLLFLLMPLYTVSAETFFHGIFPWNFGYSWLYAGWPGFQVAEFIGFYGLSLTGFLVNWMLFLAWQNRHHRMRFFAWFVGALSFVTLVNFIGYIRSHQIEEGSEILKVLQVQANIGNQDKIRAVHGGNSQVFTLDRFEKLTKEALSNKGPVDLIVWPETAFPSYLDKDHSFYFLARRFRRMVKQWKTPVFTGAYSRPSGSKKTFNAAFLFDESAQPLGDPYNKTVLLAFGEYMPFDEYVPFIRQAIPTISDFGRGTGPNIMPFQDLTLGPQICYEGLYPDYARISSQLGADILVNITNDSWFGKDAEPFQHMYMTLARAIEVRRPLVRNTNTGITTAITRSGRLLQMSPVHEEWAEVFEVPILRDAGPTHFMRWGHRLPLFILLFSALLAAIGFFLGERIERVRST